MQSNALWRALKESVGGENWAHKDKDTRDSSATSEIACEIECVLDAKKQVQHINKTRIELKNVHGNHMVWATEA